MAFQEMKKMTSRKKMIEAIASGQSVAEAARETGVSRVTAYQWLRRAQQQGFDALSEGSRRPLESPRQTPPEAVSCVWGIVAPLWRGGAAPAPEHQLPSPEPRSEFVRARWAKRGGALRASGATLHLAVSA